MMRAPAYPEVLLADTPWDFGRQRPYDSRPLSSTRHVYFDASEDGAHLRRGLPVDSRPV
jgi:hypothetical protein